MAPADRAPGGGDEGVDGDGRAMSSAVMPHDI